MSGVLSIFSRTRPKLRAENFSDADTAAKVMNTTVLTPLYSRVESLEKKKFIEVRVKTPTPASGLFPLLLPNPPFQAAGLTLAYVFNHTSGMPESLVAGIAWTYDAQGRLTVTTMTLTDAQDYTLRFRAEADDK